MSLTVRHNNYITKSDFFFVEEDNYDEHIELAIPFYLQMHEEMVRFLPANPDLKVLDLGTGTGKTAEYVFKHAPGATLVGIDLFDEMLNRAKDRLNAYQSQIKLIKGDFRTEDIGYNYDACVTALALHHLLPTEKKTLFRQIYGALKPGGVFVMIDWTKFSTTKAQQLAEQTAIAHAKNTVDEEAIVFKWAHHWKYKNIPNTVEEMQSWLLNAGFLTADCVFRYYGMSLIIAQRP